MLALCCGSPTLVPTTPPAVVTSATLAPSVGPPRGTPTSESAVPVIFQAPPTLRGDWVFALTGGVEVSGGRPVAPTTELWAVPLSGGAALRVASFTDSHEFTTVPLNALRKQFSADGRRVVFTVSDRQASGAPRLGLVLIDLAGGTVTRIGQDTADHLFPAISPDGRQVAYARRLAGVDDGLWLVNSDGSAPRRIAPAVAGRATYVYGWTPDARGIGFDNIGVEASYAVIEVASGKVAGFSGFLPLWYGAPAAWRSGGSPAFVAGFVDQPPPQLGEYRIEVGDTPGGPQRVLVRESDHFVMLGAPRWNPTSDDILYRRLITQLRAEFYVVRASGGAPKRVPLAAQPYLAEWTPGGDDIVYIAQSPSTTSYAGVSVHVAARDGSGDREILSLPDGGIADLVTFRYQ